MADRAYQYITKYFIDPVNGGVFWELDHTGKAKNTRNQVYAIAFTIYAMSEYFQASGNEKALMIARGLFYLIEKHSLDRLENGYIEALSREWEPLDDYRLSEKDANESKTMNTHLHILEAYASLFRIWKSAELEKALENIIVLFIERFIDPVSYNLNLFFNDHWELRSDEISYGHDIECSWLLYEAAEILGDEEIIKRTGSVSVEMARRSFRGVDKDHGMFNDHSPSKNHIDTDKHWWHQAEAMVGFFNAYQISGEEEFARKSAGSWYFIKKYMIDRINGEWYWRVNREGVPYTSDEKAGFWKCPYHNSRACMEMMSRIKQITT